MKKTFASLTEDARESLLNLAADTVSELHRHKSKYQDADDDEPEEPRSRAKSGDFIYDFARLNLQYLNQLASLDSNYSALGARALEKIHDYFLGPSKRDESAELTVTGKTPTHCTLRVENPFAKRAKVSIGKPKLTTKTLVAGEKPPDIETPNDDVFVDAGKTVSFRVTAKGAKARVGKTYDFALPVEFKTGERTIKDTLKLKVRRVRS